MVIHNEALFSTFVVPGGDCNDSQDLRSEKESSGHILSFSKVVCGEIVENIN